MIDEDEDLFGDIVEETVPRYRVLRKPERGLEVPDSFVPVYCDGSSLGTNGEGAAGWGWWRSEDSWASGGYLVGTNNIGELQAIIEALRSAPGDIDLLIVSDSSYAIGSASDWAEEWRRRGWMKRDKRIPENLDMVREAVALREARSGLTWFRHVRGHGKDPSMTAEDVHGNERADWAATNGSARAKAGDPSTQGPGWA